MSYLLNEHAASTHADAFSTFRREYQVFHHSVDQKGRTILNWIPTDPAVVLTAHHAEPYQGLLRKDFAAAHNADAPADVVAKVEAAFHDNIADIRATRRTVGAGSMVYLHLKDGIFQPMVQRTAPSQTPEGVPNPGVYSRPAGGITRDIRETAYRELTEELNMGVLFGEGQLFLKSFDLCPEILERHMHAALNDKAERIEWLFDQAQVPYSEVVTQSVRIKEFYVDGLSEEVHQVLNGQLSVLQKVVMFDQSNNGDVDSLIIADMRKYSSEELIIVDGETNLEGQPLGRTWILERPENLYTALNEGTKKFSPLPRKVIAQTPAILAEIGRLTP